MDSLVLAFLILCGHSVIPGLHAMTPFLVISDLSPRFTQNEWRLCTRNEVKYSKVLPYLQKVRFIARNE